MKGVTAQAAYDALLAGLSPKAIRKSFRNTGLFPFDAEKILTKAGLVCESKADLLTSPLEAAIRNETGKVFLVLTRNAKPLPAPTKVVVQQNELFTAADIKKSRAMEKAKEEAEKAEKARKAAEREEERKQKAEDHKRKVAEREERRKLREEEKAIERANRKEAARQKKVQAEKKRKEAEEVRRHRAEEKARMVAERAEKRQRLAEEAKLKKRKTAEPQEKVAKQGDEQPGSKRKRGSTAKTGPCCQVCGLAWADVSTEDEDWLACEYCDTYTVCGKQACAAAMTKHEEEEENRIAQERSADRKRRKGSRSLQSASKRRRRS